MRSSVLVQSVAVATAIACAISGGLADSAHAQAPARPAAGQPRVLFMCPHGAGKSVLASAYFQHLARERGLSVRVEFAGTEPDPTVSPTVAAHLARRGYPVPTSKPRKATSQDLAAADVVIAIECDLSGLPQPRGRVIRWDDVPAIDDHVLRADEAIRKHVSELVEELRRAAQPTRN